MEVVVLSLLKVVRLQETGARGTVDINNVAAFGTITVGNSGAGTGNVSISGGATRHSEYQQQCNQRARCSLVMQRQEMVVTIQGVTEHSLRARRTLTSPVILPRTTTIGNVTNGLAVDLESKSCVPQFRLTQRQPPVRRILVTPQRSSRKLCTADRANGIHVEGHKQLFIGEHNSTERELKQRDG